jgi:hypothetical protein
LPPFNRFSLQANVNKVLSDVRAGLDELSVQSRMLDEVRAVFQPDGSIERRYFPERSGDLPNAAALAFVVLRPEQGLGGEERERTTGLIKTLIADAGSSSRTFKSALFFVVPDSPDRLREHTRRVLAWEVLKGQADERGFDEAQRRQVEEQLGKARREVKEVVWQTYHTVIYLGADGELEELDLGLLHSSAAEALTGYVQLRLRQQDLLVDSVSPDFLVRHWPPALPRWPLRSLRDAFFASPLFPRLTDVGAIRDTVARGVSSGTFGLGGVAADGTVSSVRYREPVLEGDVDFSDETVLVSKEEAEAVKAGVSSGLTPAATGVPEEADERVGADGAPVSAPTRRRGLRWAGEMSPAKLAMFHAKVLSKLVPSSGLRLHVEVAAEPEGGLSQSQINDVRQGCLDLELELPEVMDDPIDVEGQS